MVAGEVLEQNVNQNVLFKVRYQRIAVQIVVGDEQKVPVSSC
jgi:hypothetical protein